MPDEYPNPNTPKPLNDILRGLGAPPTLPTKKIIIQGDSLSAPTGVLTGDEGTWPFYLENGFSELGSVAWQYVNIAISGKTPTTMLNEYNTLIYPHRPINAGDESWLILWGGTNDPDPENGWSKISSLIDSAISNGFKILLFSLLPGAYYRDSFNNLLLLNIGSRADGLIQPGLLFNDPADTTYYYNDLTHLKPAANQKLARRVWEEMNGAHRQPIDIGGVPYDAHDSVVCDGQYGLYFYPGVNIPAAGTNDFSAFAFYRPSGTPTVNGMAIFGGAAGCVELAVGPFGDVTLQKRFSSAVGSSRLARKLNAWHFIGITRISGVTKFVTDYDVSIGFPDTNNYTQPISFIGASVTVSQFQFVGSIGKVGYIKRGLSVQELGLIRDSMGCFNRLDSDLELLTDRWDASPANQVSDMSVNRRNLVIPFTSYKSYLPEYGVLKFKGSASGYVGDNSRMIPVGYYIKSIIGGADGSISIGESPGTPANIVSSVTLSSTRTELTVLVPEPASGKVYVALGTATAFNITLILALAG